MVNLIKDADLFTVPADILINPVNRVGISGAGLAKEFKRRFPKAEKQWKESGINFPMTVGYALTITIEPKKKAIVYFPTKHHPSDKFSDLELIEAGLKGKKQM